MCGIVGTLAAEPVATDIYETLVCLQHRGQEAAGIATYDRRFSVVKGEGLVREVVRQKHVARLSGRMGVGMVRYSTVGMNGSEETPPFVAHSPFGIAMVYNGNLYNYWDIRTELQEKDNRYLATQNDTEALLHVFAVSLENEIKRHADFFDALCASVASVFQRVRGGYSVVLCIAGKGLVAFRDPYGIRPLVWGQRPSGIAGVDHVFASEDTSFQILGYDLLRDVERGEVIWVRQDGSVQSRIVMQREFRPCIFEYVYFARPDAFLNNVSVYRARLRMGQNLARKIQRMHPSLSFDVVIPAPFSANTAALSCASVLGTRYSEGIYKNPFVGRTFIMPGTSQRQRANKYKLSVIEFEVKGKDVLVVDDSIVRGNVSRHIIEIIRRHGARSVSFASASPPLRFPDVYGIDLPTREELIAYGRSVEEVRSLIGADVLIYQDLDDLIEAVTRKGNLAFSKPHCAYFDGDYPTGDVTEELLSRIESARAQERRQNEDHSLFYL